MVSSEHPIVLFDGACNLCNGAVQFVIARDPAARFRFAALQSATARRLLGPDRPPETIVLVEGAQISVRSTAALRIARNLRFPWPLLYAFLVIPRPLRDLLYDWVARHRYSWFGKRNSCTLPSPELRNRFME